MKQGHCYQSCKQLRIRRKYYEKLYANKTDNLNGMGKFLKRHKLPKVDPRGNGQHE